MINKNLYHKKPDGFTMLELLLAIFLFGTLITILFGSFNFLLSSGEAIKESEIYYEMGKTCLERMADDLETIHVSVSEYIEPDFTEEPDIFRIVGESSYAGADSFSTLRFASFAHLPMGQSQQEGIAEIVYYVQETSDRQYVVRRRDRLKLDEEFEESNMDPILCERVKSLQFTYFDQEGEEQQTWDSESFEEDYETPKAIHILLELGDEENTYTFETAVSLPVWREKQEETI